MSSTPRTNFSPTSYWRIFCSRPSSFCICCGDPAGLAALVQHTRHALLAGDVLAAEIGHHDVAVTLEQRHQRLHLTEHAALLGRGDQRHEAALVERVLAAADRLDRVRQRPGERARIGVDELEHLLHERR